MFSKSFFLPIQFVIFVADIYFENSPKLKKNLDEGVIFWKWCLDLNEPKNHKVMIHIFRNTRKELFVSVLGGCRNYQPKKTKIRRNLNHFFTKIRSS